MTWEMWVSIIENMHAHFDYERACILEQLLCEGKLPLACEWCGHLLTKHQFEIVQNEPVRAFCNCTACFDLDEVSLCQLYTGTYVEH